MTSHRTSYSKSVCLTAMLSVLVFGLSAQRPKVLVLNGKNVGPVLQVRGRNYVDVETLAQSTNSTVTFQADRINMTMPGSPGAAEESQPKQGLSQAFATAALADLSLMREWRSAVETMVVYQVPVTGNYLQDYHARAEEGLRMAGVAATTGSDRSAFDLLQSDFNTLAGWVDNAVTNRQNLNATRTLGPDVLQNDSTLQRIATCSNFIGSMLVSGRFADSPSCH